jgi:hypothetical protein
MAPGLLMLTPANAVTRQLTWDDFLPVDVDPPEPGEFVQSAQTRVGLGVNALMTREGASKPPKYAIIPEPTITVTFVKKECWKAKFIAKWPQGDQDALLGHEQTHYLISALSGRDYFNDLKAVCSKTYVTPEAAADALNEVHARYNPQLVQDIHDEYDRQTNHDPVHNAAKQASWTTTVVGAKSANTNLRAALVTAKLITP